MVYAGAAPGNHIAALASLFPTLQFHLYDPRSMKITDDRSVTTYQTYFTDETATSYCEDCVLFISDIRADHKHGESFEDTEKIVSHEYRFLSPFTHVLNQRAFLDADYE